jgi:hypothetical protein
MQLANISELTLQERASARDTFLQFKQNELI